MRQQQNADVIFFKIQKQIYSNRKFNFITIRMGQLSALFYKNWILYKRSVAGNILQFIIPIFFIFFILMVRKLVPPTNYDQQSFINPPNPQYAFDFKDTSFVKPCKGSAVALAPTGDPLINQIYPMIIANNQTVLNFTTESEFQQYIRSTSYSTSTQICYGIIVQSSSNNLYQYSLRFNMSTRNPDGPNTNLKLTLDQGINLGLYNKSIYMISTNLLVNDAIFQLKTVPTNYLENYISPMYQETYILDQLYANLGNSIGIIALLPLLLIYLRQTSLMLQEKETKIRESMSIMGMKIRNYYFSWFVRYYAVYFILHLFCSAIISSQLKYVPFHIALIVFILFDLVLIMQNFFIQVFLTRAKIGVVISLLFFVIQYVLSFISTNSDNPTIGVNAALSVIPHVAFVLAFQTMIYAQSYQIKSNFSSTINNYVIGYALISFILNAIFYLILTWYLDQVIPNEWGAKRHPLFCCFDKTSPYSLDQKEQRKREQRENPAYKEAVEEVDQNMRQMQREDKIIQIVGLRKEFNGGQTVAVKNLTINMYNNQIFSLLGHNGAGKTTSISMLTGMIEPTDGFISVFGQVDLDKIRAMIGVCPQHDTLYQDLTVQEHIQLFATFKGLEDDELKTEVNKLINDVNLNQKRDEYSKNLSGGQKRRLSVALAFAGRSKVIILDEPTSGMDTSARRYIWELLKTYKNDRAIILTTHFMDQADYLGDRIGIMGDGKMICCGTSMYLKNKFGVGYNITFVKKSNQVSSNPIIQVVMKYVPTAKVLSNIATDLSMQLPLEGLPRFVELFKEIDEKQEHLKFAEYGISITTLQEVFLKVGEELQMQHQKQAIELKIKEEMDIPSDPEYKSNRILERQDLAQTSKDEMAQGYYDNIPRQSSGFFQFLIHFKATFLKRLRVIRRDFKSFIFQLLLPILIIIFGLLIMRISFLTDSSAQTMNVNLYLSEQNPVMVPVGSDSPAFVSTVSTALTTKYGSSISVVADSSSTTVGDFDYNTLYTKKLQTSKLKGGLYFYNAPIPNGTNTLYKYNTLVNTRSPTSFFFLSTLAAETFINNVASSNIKIQVTNYPLPRTYQQLQINNTISGFFASFIFNLALAFKFASIMAFIVKERQDRSKHQQIVSGMKLSAYWAANFIYDYILYLILAVITLALCSALSISAFTSGNAYGGAWLLFIFYGFAYIPFTYILAFAFKDYGNAQAGYYFLTFITGGMIPILTFLLRILGESSNPIGRGLAWLFRIYPAFSFGEGLLNIGSVSLYGIIQNGSRSLDALAMEVSLAPIIYLIVETVLYLALLFIVESLFMSQSFMRYFTSQDKVEDTQVLDQEDVLKQYKKANSAEPEDYQILTKHLRKVYMIDSKKKHKVAVDNLSFAVERGEVFGLLGVNGAGKSTTFKMLSGQITSTSGDSYFNGIKISQNLEKVREGLGYCPQFDALIQNLTVKEQLEMFYDMKSLKSQYKDKAISQKIKEMNLEQYTDKLSGTLSGGNKRKLSVAMAMIGNPRIVFLDQPSTGMDPKARRFMWKVISRVATEKKNSTVILTTHSMEQAEALSTRLAIMVKGNFQCIGTPQHIKSKYGEGFQIQIKLNNLQKGNIEAIIRENKLQNNRIVKKRQFQELLRRLKVVPEDQLEMSESGSGNFIYNTLETRKEIEVFTVIQFLEVCRLERQVMNSIRTQFGEIELLQRLQTFIRIKIKAKAKISRLFQFFESNKQKFCIQQYTIKQATVEQIFNKFAEQEEQTEYGP